MGLFDRVRAVLNRFQVRSYKTATYYTDSAANTVVVEEKQGNIRIAECRAGTAQYATVNLASDSIVIRLLEYHENRDPDEFIHSPESGVFPVGMEPEALVVRYQVINKNGPKILVAACRKDHALAHIERTIPTMPCLMLPGIAGCLIPGSGVRGVVHPMAHATEILILDDAVPLTYQKVPFGMRDFEKDRAFYRNEVNKVLVYFAETKLGLPPLKEVFIMSANQDLGQAIDPDMQAVFPSVDLNDEYLAAYYMAINAAPLEYLNFNTATYAQAKQDIAHKRWSEKAFAYAAAALAALGVLTLLLFAGVSGFALFQKNDLARHKEKISALKELVEQNKSLRVQQASVADILAKRSATTLCLTEISRKIPAEVWLESYANKLGAIEIQGQAYSEAHITEFLSSLESSSVFSNVRLEYTEVVAGSKRPAASAPAIRFKFTCEEAQ